MEVLALTALGQLEYQDRSIPNPNAQEVLVKIKAAGICGSDIPRTFTTGAYHFPLVLGHEFSGVIEKVGDGVDSSIIGKKVAIFPLIPCNNCTFCAEKYYARCINYSYFGSRRDGAFSEYVVVPTFNLIFLEDDADVVASAMIEPAAVALHAIRNAHLDLNDNVVIYGAGPIGIMIARWAYLYGANKVFLIDIDQRKIDFCSSLGFKYVCNSKTEDPIKWIMEHTNGIGGNVCIEGTGFSDGINNTLMSCAIMGKVIILGNPHENITITRKTYDSFMRKEATLKGTFNSVYKKYPHDEWSEAAQAIYEGRLKVDDLISHKVNLKKLKDMFYVIKEGKEFTCKVMCVNN
jgi:Threonine dehydrogenase and related Zn-dependent dehydrogenases